MSIRPSRISLHIDRLVVDGVALSAPEGLRLRRAIERELVRLLRASPPPAGHGTVATLPSPAVRLQGPPRPVELGRQVARSVHATLTRTTGAR